MLRDDAIREGRMEPNEEDIKRMNLTKDDLKDIAGQKALRAAETAPAVPAPATPAPGTTKKTGGA